MCRHCDIDPVSGAEIEIHLSCRRFKLLARTRSPDSPTRPCPPARHPTRQPAQHPEDHGSSHEFRLSSDPPPPTPPNIPQPNSPHVKAAAIETFRPQRLACINDAQRICKRACPGHTLNIPFGPPADAHHSTTSAVGSDSAGDGTPPLMQRRYRCCYTCSSTAMYCMYIHTDNYIPETASG